MKKLTKRDMALYALGMLGVGTVTVVHMLFLTWFFLPPESADLPALVTEETIFLGLSIIAIIFALRTIFDAITDPLIANFTDKLGKRVPLLKWIAIPFAASHFLVFLVPDNTVSTGNLIWLFVWLMISVFCLTVYTISHEALMPILAKTPDEKVNLGTLSSAAWFVGFLIASFSSSLWGPLQNRFGMDKITSIRWSFLIIMCIGAVFMILPGLFIDEESYIDRTKVLPKRVKTYESLRKVTKNKNFMKFVLANSIYVMATYIFESGLLFFITVLAIMEESMSGPISTGIGVVTLLMYPLINVLARKKGRKFTLGISFITFAIAFGIISIMSNEPSPWLYIGLLVLVAPFSQAGFGILPVVIASDNAMYTKFKTGEDLSGMFMGVSGFFRKIGSTFATILFTSLLLIGRSVGDDMGIRLAVIIAGILSIVGFLIMLTYDEKEVMSYTKALTDE